MEEGNKYLIPISILIAGALIGWGFMTSSKNPKTGEENTPEVQKIEVRPVSGDDHIIGNPNAEVVIVEYSDLECPYCKNFYYTGKKIMDEYGKDGKVALVFRHFPLDQLHSKARQEAIATECAANLGGNVKFWEYMDKIFENTPSNNGLDLAQLPVYAEQIGLDKAKFIKCLDDKKMADKVEADYQDGLKAGVLGTSADPGGTPYSVLVTKKGDMVQIKGAQPYDAVKLMIDTALSGTPSI